MVYNMTADEATIDVGVEDVIQAPRYILTLGVEVTCFWKDKQGVMQKMTYPVGTEFGAVFPHKRITKHRFERWIDCVTPDGVLLTIGHNSKHTLIEIKQDQELPIDKPVE
jgi:hypothetical protein